MISGLFAVILLNFAATNICIISKSKLLETYFTKMDIDHYYNVEDEEIKDSWK